jgi:hypothetical protein
MKFYFFLSVGEIVRGEGRKDEMINFDDFR